jgi:hypothetical protein
VGFKPTIPIFERVKTVHALECAITVFGSLATHSNKCYGNIFTELQITLCYTLHYTRVGDVKFESSLEFISLPAAATFALAEVQTVLKEAVRTPIE